MKQSPYRHAIVMLRENPYEPSQTPPPRRELRINGLVVVGLMMLALVAMWSVLQWLFMVEGPPE